MILTDDQIKELMPLNYEEMCLHIQMHGRAHIYAVRKNEASLIVLESDGYWRGKDIEAGIKAGILFRRRNKPYQTFMA